MESPAAAPLWSARRIPAQAATLDARCGKECVGRPAVRVDRPSVTLCRAVIEPSFAKQLGRRNLTDDQRSVIAYQVQQQRSKIARQKRAQAANDTRWRSEQPSLVQDACTEDQPTQTNSPAPTSEPKPRTRDLVAAEFHVPRRKLDQVRLIEQLAPTALQEVRDGEKTLAEAGRAIAVISSAVCPFLPILLIPRDKGEGKKAPVPVPVARVPDGYRKQKTREHICALGFRVLL